MMNEALGSQRLNWHSARPAQPSRPRGRVITAKGAVLGGVNPYRSMPRGSTCRGDPVSVWRQLIFPPCCLIVVGSGILFVVGTTPVVVGLADDLSSGRGCDREVSEEVIPVIAVWPGSALDSHE